MEFIDSLTAYEQIEIQQYDINDIFFLGVGAKKISSTDIHNAEDDFDDLDSCYKLVIGDHLNYRYEIVRKMGQGCYGQVVEAFDHKYKRRVAIKIIRHCAYFREQYIQEVEKLEYLNNKFKDENHVNSLHDKFEFRGHSCIVLELLHQDLCNALITNDRKGFNMLQLQKIIRSLLKCLSSIHSVFLIHGDLKPANIAFKKEDSTDVKLIDLGSSRFGFQEYTDYVQSQYYRAPEIILHLPYSLSIDVWSVGCIAFELATGQILFEGEDKDDQLTRIIEVLGLPPTEMLKRSVVAERHFTADCQPKYCTTELANRNIKKPYGSSKSGKKRGLPGSKDLTVILKEYPAEFIKFLRECLAWNPLKRITADKALSHEWLLQNNPPI